MLCLKVLDGASVDPGCSALPGVSFSKQAFPSYAAEAVRSVHAPELARLSTHTQPGPANPVPTPGASRSFTGCNCVFPQLSGRKQHHNEGMSHSKHSRVDQNRRYGAVRM